MAPRKSKPEDPLLPLIEFHPPSNGEFSPLPPPPRAQRALSLWQRVVEEKHRRLGMTRREFATSASGTAAALWAINQVACSSEDSAHFDVDPEMLDDIERAQAVLDGDEFIFDVQVHVSSPLEPFEYGNPPERALDFITQVFVQSDTTVACISGVPNARDLGAPNVAARVQLTEILDRLAGPRAILHANADPERGAAELDYMAEIADSYPLSAWKIYPHAGSYLLDSDEVGGPFLERVRDLGIRVVAAHRGISNAGGYESAGSPRDVVLAARDTPDIDFLVYHSGWEAEGDENHPYDPENSDAKGVDRLVKAVLDAGQGTAGNVYAELGTTWANLMNDPDAAAHVLGKLLLHLGPDRIVWGTDSVFNGVPQGQIVAFRAFQIPEAMQEQYGYPALTDEIRRKIFGLNAARVYGVDVEATRYAIDDDDVANLRSAYRDDSGSVRIPSRYAYTGPRTRREFLRLQAADPHPPRRSV